MEESVGACSSKSTPPGPTFKGAAGEIRGTGGCVAEQQRSISSYTTRTRRCGSAGLIWRYHVEILGRRASTPASTRKK